MAKSRYAVKSATLTFGGTAYEMANGPSGKSETREAVEVTALTDQIKQFIPGAVKEINEFSVTLYSKGEGDLTVDAAPAALKLDVVLSNGEDADVSASVEFGSAMVTAVAPTEQDASGDRKATYQVTFRPSGSNKVENGGW
jgi:hypothetical protein